MSNDDLGSYNSEDESFRNHLKQMMDSQTNGANDDMHFNSNGTGDGARLESPTTSVNLEDESPFKEPISGPMSTSISAAPNLTTSGAYPRPQAAEMGHAASRVEQVKTKVQEFTIDTFRTTKQIFSEMMGKGTRTVDPHLDTQVHELKELQITYSKLIEEAFNLQSYFSNVIYTQRQMVMTLGELSHRDKRLEEDFNYNAETQRVLAKNGDQLIAALKFFTSNMKTLVEKTMQDCLDTIKKYEAARLAYDTYRHEHEKIIHSGGGATLRSAEIKQKYEEKQKKYEQMKDDLSVKIKFLEENRVKVVHRQMLLFHNSISAYFSGNQSELEQALTQFNIKLRSPNAEPPSWLESN